MIVIRSNGKDTLIVCLPFQERLLFKDVVKRGRRYDGVAKAWVVSGADGIASLEKFLAQSPSKQIYVDPCAEAFAPAVYALRRPKTQKITAPNKFVESEHPERVYQPMDVSRAMALGRPGMPEPKRHQLVGISWIAHLPAGSGGLLADDPGAGKTMMCLLGIEQLHRWHRNAYPAIIVCPGGVRDTWLAECEMWAKPSLNVHVIRPGRANLDSSFFDEDERLDIVIVGIDNLFGAWKALSKINAKTLVIDEAHLAKDEKTRRFRFLSRLELGVRKSGGRVICMSGTPYGNHGGNCGRILYLCGRLSDSGCQDLRSFDLHYGKDATENRTYELGVRLRHTGAMLRRDVNVWRSDMPRMSRRLYRVVSDADAEFRAAAAAIRQEVLEACESGVPISGISLMGHHATLTRLAGIAKVPAIVSLACALIEQGDPVLIFCSNTQVIDEVADGIRKSLKVEVMVLDGRTPRPLKESAQHDWQTGSAMAFVIHYKSGGTGLTLTRARKVILAQATWSYDDMKQAEMRTADRTSQQFPVVSYWMCLKDSIEEAVMKRVVEKATQSSKLLDGQFDSNTFGQAIIDMTKES